MLTKLTVRNFKRFGNVEIELGSPVVFVGPNNSGKTTALQALALWEIGIRKWTERRQTGKSIAKKRTGVVINRRDLNAVPVPDAALLWRNLHVRDVKSVNGKPQTKNVRVEIVVSGVDGSDQWTCGLEYDYANEESLYCRPLGASDSSGRSLEIPDQAARVKVSFLPPMSGLSDREFAKQPGEIAFLLGQGLSGEVLRNLCYQIALSGEDNWDAVSQKISELFGERLERPILLPERSEIVMTYRNRMGKFLSLSSTGRGHQQTLLLLVYLAANPGSVLLLDEPDAHLEVLRQRQIYQVLSEAAKDKGSQIIIASHSEIILSEAADRDVVVAFLGRPHRINDRGSHLLKSLREIGYEQYYLAEQKGWVLYVEGSTDLAILQAFAKRLNHPCAAYLEQVFMYPIGNQPRNAKSHFYGLREAKRDLVGFVLCDGDAPDTDIGPDLLFHKWLKKEIENYLCQPDTLLAYAEWSGQKHSVGKANDAPLLDNAEGHHWRSVMQQCINDLLSPTALRDARDVWWNTVKASDDFLDRVFEKFYGQLGLENLMRKSGYHELANHVPVDMIDPEITEVLDAIGRVAAAANPAEENDN